MLAPGDCDLSGNKLADHQANLEAAEIQPNNALEPPTWRTLTRRSSCFPPIKHERLKEVYTPLPDEQIKTSFAKTESTDLARFHSGHHPALRCWQHLAGISEDVVCRLSGEGVKSAEHLWLRCPALLVERHHSDLGHTMNELIRLPCAALALLKTIRWCQQQQNLHQHILPDSLVKYQYRLNNTQQENVKSLYNRMKLTFLPVQFRNGVSSSFPDKW